VGCVIHRDGRIIATGYNGAPAGMPHCNHDMEIDASPVSMIDTGCQVVEHAERNAIAFAARYGNALEGAWLTCTHAPCLACAKSIINAGIVGVTYKIPYRLTDGVELLERAQLKIIALPNL